MARTCIPLAIKEVYVCYKAWLYEQPERETEPSLKNVGNILSKIWVSLFVKKKEEKIADILSSVHFWVANVTISYSVHETETNKNNGENKMFTDGNKFITIF